MNLTELEGKEIININDGSRLGMVAGTELTFDPNTGELESIMIPQQGGVFSLFSTVKHFFIPWSTVIKIGDEVIIVDLNSTDYDQYLSHAEY
ncbi:YlmC/YmxH family sporulation protein [Orenia marismortui]|uniref:YlmC/YmxH family sporulation protein n=1 Tax=Orenia marismortui TaxID=46469 RepID=UPI00037940BF|nr:YlmC/YmxH family sporulation protein [Orenia marismortui]